MRLSVKQAADRLKVHQNLVYRLVAAKRIAHERIGFGRGVIRIPEEAVEAYAREARRGPATAVPARTRTPLPRLKHFVIGA